MYVRGEHNPPHFHALYGGYEALVDIQKLEVIEGFLDLTFGHSWSKLSIP